MKYTKEERLEIGRRIYQREITLATAAVEYDVNFYTARDYLRLYKARENVSIPQGLRLGGSQDDTLADKPNICQYEKMSREELMDELIKAKIDIARAKNAMK